MEGEMGRQGETAKRTRIACRAIVRDDEEAIVALLCAGFPERAATYWRSAVDRLRRRRVPEGLPRYGYCLTVDDRPVGVVLLICSSPVSEGSPIRCCVSSWYVEAPYRVYASALAKVALKRDDCTYLNMSSLARTRKGLVAQGYSCYARGQFLAAPALGHRVPGVVVHAAERHLQGFGAETARLLRDHAEAGCISLSCTSDDGAAPFVFLKRFIRNIPVPCAQLIYCESIESFVSLQGPIGRYLMRRGLFWVMLDANGPVPGLRGLYVDDRMPKYFKGSSPPRLGDLAYSEAMVFGP